ncbi:MAG TPA: thiamine pyrophosphate-binding protein [Labilithrix sp.]|nr:thiamine pyrophosphate-binding protein [Labilithrix sp.]
MAESVSDFIVRRMAHWGVRRVFGYPGDGINGLMGAFGRGGHEIEFIQPRHEELAAFMACARTRSSRTRSASASRRPGRVPSTS